MTMQSDELALTLPRFPKNFAAALCDQVGHDHLLAAWTATLKQRKVESDAKAMGLTVEDYLRETNQFPVTDWKARPQYEDEMEADYMRAFQHANMREFQRQQQQSADEAAAIAAGLTAEQYEQMCNERPLPFSL
jgi:hypothetical protein